MIRALELYERVWQLIITDPKPFSAGPTIQIKIVRSACTVIAAKMEGDDERVAYEYDKGRLKKEVLTVDSTAVFACDRLFSCVCFVCVRQATMMILVLQMERAILNGLKYDVYFPSAL